jgi:hypothetical protein
MPASVKDDHEDDEPIDNPPPIAEEVRPIPMPAIGAWSSQA